MSQVRVRMYRLGGIGDCFLLSFQDGKGPHMLIDCGVLKGTPGGTETITKAIQNVRKVTKNKLDILAVTHEHWDHVSGFFQAQKEFMELPIKEVWLAWTEKRGNKLADHLREEKEKAKKAVAKACLKLRGALGADEEGNESLDCLEKLSLFYAKQDPARLGMGEETDAVGYSPADAMEWACQKTGGRVRYLSPEMDAIPIPGAKGVRVFVLGPPESEEAIKKDKPSKTSPEVYSLAAGNNLGFMAAVEALEGGGDETRPFHPSFEIEVEKARQDEFFIHRYFVPEESWRTIELDWLYGAERLALQLDSDTNNTSLALAIELVDKDDSRVLVFPGDAQVGNWVSWETLHWNARDEHGEPEQVKAEELLKRTVLYKVGHHASHNATTRWGLERMAGEGLAALIPVYEEQAHKQGKKGWDMPFPPLLKRLKEKTEGRVFRADMGIPTGEVSIKHDIQDGWVDVWVGN
jgi:hypothetical protein